MTEYEGQFAGQIFEALSVGLACGAVTLLALSPSLGQGFNAVMYIVWGLLWGFVFGFIARGGAS
ncbi:MAG: hypothetical protein JKP92_03030 [Alphaproteobacteria bacterium]|jgi:lipopolysaccharide export LptBFGC system permease protein LptF|nr:hypothetical protein [Alphaproteobacteria bacterium]